MVCSFYDRDIRRTCHETWKNGLTSAHKMEHITLRIPKGVSSPAESVMLFFAPIFFKGANLHFFLSTIFPAAFEKCGKLHALLLCSKIVKSVEELKRECGASNWGSTLEKPKNLMQILFSKRQEHNKKGGKKERDTQRGQSESQEGTPSLFHFLTTW